MYVVSAYAIKVWFRLIYFTAYAKQFIEINKFIVKYILNSYKYTPSLSSLVLT
jgi:hypothetical protein